MPETPNDAQPAVPAPLAYAAASPHFTPAEHAARGKESFDVAQMPTWMFVP